MNCCIRRMGLLVAGLILLFAPSAFAQEITLHSANGAISLTGKLLLYNGEYYRLKTIYGPITMRALGVTCTGAACPNPAEYAADITISGTRAVTQDLLAGLLDDFTWSNGLHAQRKFEPDTAWTAFLSDSARIPVARLQARASNSSRAFQDLIAKKSDMILTNRPPTAKEAAAANKARLGDISSRFRQQLLALDAVVFLVSPQNPVRSLTLDQIAGIFSGQITNWAEVGGINAPISVLQLSPKTDLAKRFKAMVFPGKSGPSPVKSRYFMTNREISEAIMKDPLAIGFSGFSGIRNARALAIRGSCGILQHASRFSVASGDYPLSFPYLLITPAKRLPTIARDFLAYLRGRRAQTVISNLGFVGLGMMPTALGKQQDRLNNAIAHSSDEITLTDLQNMVTALGSSRRTTATFRFQDNATTVDSRALRDVKSLAEMLDSGDFDGHKLIFAGFSDSKGSADANQKISQSRAAEVKALVQARAVRTDLSKVRFQAIGFGEVSPLACNDSDTGRKINRRVEVWVK